MYNLSDIKSNLNKYSTKSNLQYSSINNDDAISDVTCEILRLPSISTRHCISNPYVNRNKRHNSIYDKSKFETPFTVELRLYSPMRAYVLLDSESDEIIDYLTAQYKSMGWNVLNLNESQISFIKIIRQYLKTHVVPRIKNNVIQKDIMCITNDNDGDKSDNNNS